ncbi:MAG: HD domain-containing protein [Candidatus Daviesbacteria bacterium]|nr:HD domain-containing protein [Candidatus Daviesbacteria bacterium]
MIYNTKIQEAVRFATKVHNDQTRKGKDEPYIIHPLSVSLILSKVTSDEDIIVAGILHDTIEDCKPYGSITKELLVKEFCENVARMVNDVTEQDKTLPWKVRKAAAFNHIKKMKHDSLLLKSADVLNNLSELNNDIEEEGLSVFNRFNASKENSILRYRKLIPEIKKAWDKNPLVADLEFNLDKLLDLTK